MDQTKKKPRTVAVIPSAGMGKRMNSGGVKKTYMPLLGLPTLAHTLAAFEECPAVDSVVLAVPAEDIEFCKTEVIEKFGFRKVIKVVPGGAERQDSVANGIEAAGPGWDIIAVHDGARPLVTPDIIEDVVDSAVATGAAVSAVPVKDTIKEAVDPESTSPTVRRTLPRRALWAVHTPQAFKAETLIEAHRMARKENYLGTDESSLVERLGVEVTLVRGSNDNIKITTQEDLALAAAILQNRKT